jgi:hypothetical protein
MHYRSVAFTLLELDGLLDPKAEPEAYQRAMDKILLARDDKPRKATPVPASSRKAGAPINLMRLHREKNCGCVECRRSA